MVEVWKHCKLGDVITLQRGFDLPERDRQVGNVPIISSSGISGHHNIAKVRAPGVVTGRYGTLGEVFYVKQDFWPLNTSLYVRDFKGNNPLFISYFMRTLNLAHQNGAGAVPGVNRNALHLLPVRIPVLSIQRKIANILSAYDDLIENNTRRIAILEEMARTLYQEWFVKFRFPGREQDVLNDLQEDTLPEGWHEVNLADVCSITMGQSPNSEFYNQLGDGLPFHQGVSDFGDRFPTDRVYCTLENRIAQTGDILFSVRAPVGRINISTKKIVIGRGLCAIRSKTNDQEFVFQQLKEQFQEEDQIGNGSIFKAVTKEDVYNIKLIWPSDALLHDFKMYVQPVFSSLEILYQKNVNLRRTRDLLLPKLITDEIDVSSWLSDEEKEQEEIVVSEMRGAREMEPAQPIDVAAMQQRMLWE